MLDRVIINSSGIFSVIMVIILARNIFKSKLTTSFNLMLVSSIVGLLIGFVGVVFFSFLFMIISDKVSWFTDINYLWIIPIASSGMIFSAYLFGKMASCLFRKYFACKPLVYAAIISAFLIILHPIAYGWLKLAGIF